MLYSERAFIEVEQFNTVLDVLQMNSNNINSSSIGNKHKDSVGVLGYYSNKFYVNGDTTSAGGGEAGRRFSSSTLMDLE
ncbi:hypothetical protein GPALN_013281 [Globodera pallida]|nr:hypothetical protein GPALN_013281 [Globodera pallida]